MDKKNTGKKIGGTDGSKESLRKKTGLTFMDSMRNTVDAEDFLDFIKGMSDKELNAKMEELQETLRSSVSERTAFDRLNEAFKDNNVSTETSVPLKDLKKPHLDAVFQTRYAKRQEGLKRTITMEMDLAIVRDYLKYIGNVLDMSTRSIKREDFSDIFVENLTAQVLPSFRDFVKRYYETDSAFPDSRSVYE